MSIRFPQLEGRLPSGGADIWDVPQAGAILVDEYFAAVVQQSGTAVFTRNSTGGTNAGVADAYISTFVAGTNTGSDPTLICSVGDISSLLQLTDIAGTGGVPSGATVTAVEIDLCYESSGAFVLNGDTLTAREVLAAWIETQVTWNNRITATAWGTAGALGAGDVAAAVSSTYTFAGGGVDGTYYRIPSSPALVADVQAWVDGSINGSGWKIESSGFPVFQSSEGFDGQRPIIRVSWVLDGVAGFSTWNGSVWTDKPAKVWNGSAWQTKPVKRWSGSAWL